MACKEPAYTVLQLQQSPMTPIGSSTFIMDLFLGWIILNKMAQVAGNPQKLT